MGIIIPVGDTYLSADSESLSDAYTVVSLFWPLSAQWSLASLLSSSFFAVALPRYTIFLNKLLLAVIVESHSHAS